MSAKSGNQRTVAANRTGVLRAPLVMLILLLAAVLSGCTEGYPNYYITVDQMLGQSNVELVHALPKPTQNYASRVALVNDTALAVGTNKSVYFVDTRDPADPAVISVIEVPDSNDRFSIDLMAADGYIYATDGDRFDSSMFVIDIREPASPQLVNRIEEGVRGRGWVAEGGYLYIHSALLLGIQIWDATESSAPFVAGVYYPPQSRVDLESVHPSYNLPPVMVTARQVEAEKALGDFSANNDLPVCDDPYGGSVSGADVEDGLLYILVGNAFCIDQYRKRHIVDESGLWVVDVRNPAEPLPLGFLSMGDAFLEDITVAGDYAYLAALTDGLIIVDISDPTQPVLVGGHATPEGAYGVAVEEQIAYTMDRSNVQVFDVANPAKPVRIGMMAEGFHSLEDIVVHAGYIYVIGQNYATTSGSNLFVLRLIDPEARPEELLWGVSSD